MSLLLNFCSLSLYLRIVIKFEKLEYNHRLVLLWNALSTLILSRICKYDK